MKLNFHTKTYFPQPIHQTPSPLLPSYLDFLVFYHLHLTNLTPLFLFIILILSPHQPNHLSPIQNFPVNSSSSPEHSPLSSSPISFATPNSSSSTVPSPPPHNTHTMIPRAKAGIHKPKLPFTSLTQSSSSVDWSQMEPIKFSDAI